MPAGRAIDISVLLGDGVAQSVAYYDFEDLFGQSHVALPANNGMLGSWCVQLDRETSGVNVHIVRVSNPLLGLGSKCFQRPYQSGWLSRGVRVF